MESVSATASLNFQFQRTTIYAFLSPSTLSLPCLRRRIALNRGVCFSLRTGSEGGNTGGQDSYGFDLLQKPIVAALNGGANGKPGKEFDDDFGVDEEEKGGGEEREWVDWEDQILEDTVPLVGFARMVLHSGRYQCGDKLRPSHQKAVLERLLPYHPDCDKKIDSGVDYITIGYHPKFEDSRCLFIVRKDGEKVDFSYWKCIKGLIRKNYPLYADTFMQRHFQRRTRGD